MKLETWNNKRGTEFELKISVKEWNQAKLPFVLLLSYNDEKDKSAIRIVLSKDDISKECYTDVLQKFFKEDSDGSVRKYSEIRDGKGYWRNVLKYDNSKKEDQSTSIDANFFEGKFWRKVKKKLERQLDKLAPSLNEFFNEN